MKTLTLCSIALALLAGDLAAQTRARRESTLALLNSYDDDKDERVSRKEWRKSKKLFEQSDLDKDGYLVYGELLAMTAPDAADATEAMAEMIVVVPLNDRLHLVDIVGFDENRDGRLSLREYEDWVFALADQTADGSLQLEEVYHLVRYKEFGAAANHDEAVFISRLDRSRDGRVSRAEFALDEKLLSALDLDGDGALSAEELGGGAPEGVQAFANLNPDTFLERYDKNEDGVLSGGELPGGTRSLFARSDGNEDGKIDRDELAATLRMAQKYQFATMETTFLDRYDLNDDGKVTRREYPGDDTTFARLDQNGDGSVTRADG